MKTVRINIASLGWLGEESLVSPHRARAAITAALPADLARKLSNAPDHLLDLAVALVVEDHCSVEETVEAVTLAVQLGEAAEKGELAEAHGLEIMRFLAERQRGAPPD